MSSTAGIEKFVRGPKQYKYTAILKNGTKVNFGHKSYQQYKDSVPVSMGGGLYTSKNHGDEKRRASYKARHSGVKTKGGKRAIDVVHSPSWFSYHFLW